MIRQGAVKRVARRAYHLPKCATGIRGLDEITDGGLPRGRATLVCGDAGTGKTLLALEFLMHGAAEHGEPGVFVAFEENAEELEANVKSLGFDLHALVAAKKVFIDHVSINRHEIVKAGEYDLQALFIRLESAIAAVGARRVVLDTIETLLAAFPDTLTLRSELQRLFRWLKKKGLTFIVTAERGGGQLTRYGIEEYVSDCVIALDQTLSDQIGTRHLRIAKYRGSAHGTNQYPFLVDDRGITVVPITSLRLRHRVSSERISTGVQGLDRMLGGRGYYRGTTAMVSGTPGSGKTSLAAQFVHAACARGERVLYFSFEETPEQIERNMRSIGIDLAPHVRKGRLQFHSSRPSTCGLEMHLALMHQAVEAFAPRVVVIDPITDFEAIGKPFEVKAMLVRMVDFLKSRQITALFTSLTAGGAPAEQTEAGISSLIDTWILVRNIESAGERTRALYVLKSRGMAHSNQVREFLLTGRGVRLVDVYVGSEGILTGSSRTQQEARERGALVERAQEAQRRRRMLAHRRRALEARIAAMEAEFEAQIQEIGEGAQADDRRSRAEALARSAAATTRQGGKRRPQVARRRKP